MTKLLLATLLAAIAQGAVVVMTPIEAVMGPVQKIFYIHVPLAWWSFVSFGLCAVAGALFLKRKDARFDRMAHAAAEAGLVLNTLSLCTGSYWARQSWGVWWTWDPRLTTALVLWFLYAGVLILRHMDIPIQRKRVVCAVVGAVAFLDVPLVFFSARMWRSIHPAVFASRDGGLDPQMLYGILIAIAAMGLVWWMLIRTRIEVLALESVAQDRMEELLSGEDPLAKIKNAMQQRALEARIREANAHPCSGNDDPNDTCRNQVSSSEK